MIITVTPNPCMDKTLSVAHFSVDKTNRATRVAAELGGKGINVATALRVLGKEVLCTGFDFADATPSFLTRQLDARGIVQDFLRVSGELRCCTKIFDESKNAMVEVNERGDAVTAADADALLAKIARMARDAALLVLSGSLPTGLSPGFYADLIRAVRESAPACRVVVDAEGEALLAALDEAPFLIKPNANEFAATFGTAATLPEIDRTARELIEAGRVQTVCVSLGGEGAYLADATGAYTAAPAAVRVQSLTGAGDAMVAGLCTAFADGKSLAEALAFGIAASGVAVSHKGTAFGTRDEFDALLPTVRVQKLR